MEKPNQLKNEIRSFILNWNNKYPIDLWWRNKHNIPFGSKIHKDISFLDMIIEYEEDRLRFAPEMKKIEEEIQNKKEIDKDFEEFEIEDYE